MMGCIAIYYTQISGLLQSHIRRVMSCLMFALCFACLLLTPGLTVALNVDVSVLESGRYGRDVVLLTVAYVQQAAIFANRSILLQRIACVETQDGFDREAFNEGMNGGIWAVRKDALTSTQVGSDPLLVQKREQIMLTFGINWEAVHWNELSKPLYSALAAQLVLFNTQGSIPSDADVMAQAQFWRDNYNADGILQDFINAAKTLKGGFRLVYIVDLELLAHNDYGYHSH